MDAPSGIQAQRAESMGQKPKNGDWVQTGDVRDALRQCDGLTYSIERVNGLRDNRRTERSRPTEVQGGCGDADSDVSRLQLVGHDK